MTPRKPVTQQFLDSSQYATETILNYEAIYGEDFVSPGGRALAREMIARMGLATGSRVLDVGCGLGGAAFVMAAEFGFEVDGIDLSRNMLEIANRKLAAYGLGERVRLEWGDCLELDGERRYHGIYSRDVFLHIEDKPRLLALLQDSLLPGGCLLFTDYCCGPKPWDDDFRDYVGERGYSLLRVDEYDRLLRQAGFEQVVAEDISERFAEILASELERIDGLDLEREARDKLRRSWQDKLRRSRSGQHLWGLLIAHRR